MEARTQQLSAPSRPAHPVMPVLVAGVDLSASNLSARDGSAGVLELAQMMANAEYWISFELAAFESLLAKSPSPLRELGVAVALRFSEGLDGGLSTGDIRRAREAFGTTIPEDLRRGIEAGLSILERGVNARESISSREKEGFQRYAFTQSLSVHALRAMGRSNISIARCANEDKKVQVRIGEEISLAATDEKGRPLSAPEIESLVEAPLYVREGPEPHRRTIFLLVPGEYIVRVPGRATGDRKLIAT